MRSKTKKIAFGFIAMCLILQIIFLSSCSSIRLGNSGCVLKANYTASEKNVYGCVVCNTDSMKAGAFSFFKKTFPKTNFNNFENFRNINGTGAVLNYRGKHGR